MGRRLIGMLAAVALTGCITIPGRNPTEASSNTRSRVDLEVNNNMIPPGPAYIYMMTPGGIERDMGTVFGGSQVLTYKGLALTGNYQFVAKTGERTIVSPVFVMNNVLGLHWDLERNFMQVTRRAE